MINDRYLFRGFHKDENGTEAIYLNGEEIKGNWIYGYLVKSEDYIFDYSERIDIPYIIPTNNFNLKDYKQYKIIPETVGQYTGFKDKSDVKIFEGDIVNGITGKPDGNDLLINNMIVTFNYMDLVGLQHTYELEVIGNIYEKEVE